MRAQGKRTSSEALSLSLPRAGPGRCDHLSSVAWLQVAEAGTLDQHGRGCRRVLEGSLLWLILHLDAEVLEGSQGPGPSMGTFQEL